MPFPAVASRSSEVRNVREDMQPSHFQQPHVQQHQPPKVETSKPIEVVQAKSAPPVRSSGVVNAVAKAKGVLGKAPTAFGGRKDDNVRPSRPDWIEHEESEVSPSRQRAASGSSEELGLSSPDVQAPGAAKHMPQERPERLAQNDLRRDVVRDARPPPPSVPPPSDPVQQAQRSAPSAPWARRAAAPVGQMAPVRDAQGASVTSRSGEAAKWDDGYKEMQSAQPKPQPQPQAPPIKLENLKTLEAEDDVSEVASGDEAPPEHAVLDLMVPRTALVINISHVLKRLNGCCSLNQLTKQIRSFKEKTGMSLEAFLRANPMTFKLEGRIVYLVDRDGEKWTPPKQENPMGNTERGKGKGKSEGKSRGDARGKSGGHKGDPRSGENHRNGKGARGKSNGAPNGGQWSTGWDEWQDDWKANNWKGSW